MSKEIEKLRNIYKSETTVEIASLEKSLTRDKENLKYLESLNLETDVLNAKKNNILENISKKEEKIVELKNKFEKYDLGELDSEIKEVLSQNLEKVKKSLEKNKKTLTENKEQKKRDLEKLSVFEKRNKRDDRSLKKDYDYYYKLFLKADETLPPYMRDKLKYMPNNKGYIWRDCWFFGEKKPDDENVTVMFEKKRGGILHIHEIDNYGTRIYEKVGNERKRFLKEIPKTMLKNTGSRNF